MLLHPDGMTKPYYKPGKRLLLIQITCLALSFLTPSDNPAYFEQILIVLKHTKKGDINIFPKPSLHLGLLRGPATLLPNLLAYL